MPVVPLARGVPFPVVRAGFEAIVLPTLYLFALVLRGEAMTVKDWKSKVAGLGCILCRSMNLGETPANLHHVREGQGMSQRGSDWLCIPLCWEHHQGKTGVHGGQFYQLHKLDELDLLALTIEAMAK